MLTETDLVFARMAIDEARKCVSEPGKASPLVAAIAVKNGRLLGIARRGEYKAGEHAEYTLLELKLKTESLTGATVYTTLEPCTKRNHPKRCCADRLIDRKVSKVVIGMHDPNNDICGKGVRLLQRHNIEVDFFPLNLVNELEELNRDFRLAQEARSPGDAWQSSGANELRESSRATIKEGLQRILEMLSAINVPDPAAIAGTTEGEAKLNATKEFIASQYRAASVAMDGVHLYQGCFTPAQIEAIGALWQNYQASQRARDLDIKWAERQTSTPESDQLDAPMERLTASVIAAQNFVQFVIGTVRQRLADTVYK